jgi:hypothetical protein
MAARVSVSGFAGDFGFNPGFGISSRIRSLGY